MNPERWNEIARICNSALDLEPGQRNEFIRRACAGDKSLRREVERLLARQQEAEEFIEVPGLRDLAQELTHALPAGLRLGPYEIVALVGTGGMGEIYEARDTRLGRRVAIKVLPSVLASDPERRRRFEHEARAASALNHPNICTVYDIGLAESWPGGPAIDYLVMEFIEGPTLADRLRKGPLPLDEALEVGAQIADALGSAHREGIVHRDLKPGNIMLAGSGARLLDFGLAKLKPAGTLGARTGISALPNEEPVSTPGTVLGTVPYMAPEQLEGKETDARTDIFAFGAVLYEMLTGRRAFEGGSQASLVGAIMKHDPPPLSLRPVTPPALEHFIRKCLAKNPEERWRSSAELVDELHRLMKPRSDHASRRLIAIASFLVVVLIAGWIALRPGQEVDSAGIDWSGLPRPLTSLPGMERDPTFSPDGNHVAFVWNGGGDGHFHVYTIPAEGGAPFQITGAAVDDAKPAWSPGGDRIAFMRLAERGLEVWSASFPGCEERLVRSLQRIGEPFSTGLEWSPDGRYLATQEVAPGGSRAAIFLIDTESADVSWLTFPPMAADIGDANPTFSPDGREVAFFRVRSGWGMDIYVQGIADGRPDGEPRQLVSGAVMYDLAWSPDGMELLYTTALPRGLWRIPVNGGKSAAVTTAQDARDLAVDLTGRRLVYGMFQANADIWRMPGPDAIEKTDPARFIHSTRNDGQPRYSPDGTRIAFMSDRSGSPNIWLAGADGAGERQITRDAWSTMPQWSPRGDAIAFHSALTQLNGSEIFTIGLTDAHRKALTGEGRPARANAIWSPDGAWIFFHRRRDEPDPDGTAWGIWKVPSTGGASELVSPTGAAPFGIVDQFVYFTRGTDPLRPRKIWRAPLRGGEAQPIVDARVYSFELAVWRGRLVYVDRFQRDGPVLQAFEITSGRTTTLARLDPDSFPSFPVLQGDDFLWGGFTVSPDGRWILFGRRTITDSDLMIIEAGSGER